MRVDKTSSTADMVTAIRALYAKYDPVSVFHDDLAYDLMSDGWRQFYDAGFLRKSAVLLCGALRPGHATILGRARFVEDALGRAIVKDGVTQYVIVGAGMDSFAYRRRDLSERIKVIELDHPATQVIKQERLSKLDLPELNNLEYVATNFEHESVAEALGRSGFDQSLPALYCWMGVTFYLEKAVSFKALESMRDVSAPGSSIVFDYVNLLDLDSWKSRQIFKIMKSVAGSQQEPFVGEFERPELESELLSRGFEIVDSLSGRELGDRYFSAYRHKLFPINAMNMMHVRIQ